MNQTTEHTTPSSERPREFSQGFILSLISLTGATLILVFLFERGVWRNIDVNEYFGSWKVYRFGSLLFPWIVAAAHTINNGLNEFSGHTPQAVALGNRIALLVGLLISGVVGPTLFFLGWRERVKQSVAGAQQRLLRGSALVFAFGAVVTFLVAIPAVPVSIARMVSENKLREAQAIQSNRDMIINDLNFIAYNARQYRILPKAMTGGSGSYDGFVLSADLASTPHATYSLTSVEPARIKLLARSTPYPNCTVSVEVRGDGRLGFWTYSGDFQ
jgi:hypothetical protein